jgi:hypothetical protein
MCFPSSFPTQMPCSAKTPTVSSPGVSSTFYLLFVLFLSKTNKHTNQGYQKGDTLKKKTTYIYQPINTEKKKKKVGRKVTKHVTNNHVHLEGGSHYHARKLLSLPGDTCGNRSAVHIQHLQLRQDSSQFANRREALTPREVHPLQGGALQ